MIRTGRPVGRPAGHSFTAADGVRLAARIAMLADIDIHVDVKLQILAQETEHDRFTRNYLLANRVRKCVFCPEIRYVMGPHSWKAHLRSARHLDRERQSVNSM
jgi:hypothetical protein